MCTTETASPGFGGVVSLLSDASDIPEAVVPRIAEIVAGVDDEELGDIIMVLLRRCSNPVYTIPLAEEGSRWVPLHDAWSKIAARTAVYRGARAKVSGSIDHKAGTRTVVVELATYSAPS